MQAPLSSTASGRSTRTGPPFLPPGKLSETGGNPIDASSRQGSGDSRGWRPRLSGWQSGASPVSQIAEGVGLAHDAGNLLGALGLYCDLLARPGVLREEHHHYADELQLLSQRSRTLIDRLLNPATTERNEPGARSAKQRGAASSGLHLVPEVTSERVVVPEVIEQCRGLLNMIARRAIAVVYDADAALPVAVKREAVERILVNLTKNAAEATEPGRAITLRVSRVEPEAAERAGTTARRGSGKGGAAQSARIVLSVEDQGRGMSVAAVKVLLEKEHRAISADEQRQAMNAARGLGLQVVRELVRDSGGELRLKSESGCGTTVEITWAVAGDGTATAWDGERQAVPAAAGNEMSGTEGGTSC